MNNRAPYLREEIRGLPITNKRADFRSGAVSVTVIKVSGVALLHITKL
jgi:hypothetical protein